MLGEECLTYLVHMFICIVWSRYLHLHQREVCAGIVRITIWDWMLILVTTMPLLYGVMLCHASQRHVAFVLSGYVILLVAAAIDWKIWKVLHVLTPAMPRTINSTTQSDAQADEERTELNPAANRGSAANGSQQVGCAKIEYVVASACIDASSEAVESESLTAELFPSANQTQRQSNRTGADDISRISALCPAAQNCGLPGSHTGLFWTPCRRCRAKDTASTWGEEFTRNMISVTLLATAGYTAAFFQTIRASMLDNDLHDMEAPEDGHRDEHHARYTDNSHILSYSMFAVGIGVSMTLMVRGRVGRFISLMAGLFVVWASGAVSVTLVPLSVEVFDLSARSLLLVTLAVLPPMGIVGIIMPSAAYNFTLSTAVEDMWREALVHKTLKRKSKIVHILGMLLQSSRKRRRVQSSFALRVDPPDNIASQFGLSAEVPVASSARSLELGRSFDCLIAASQREPGRATSETPTLNAAQFGLLLQHDGAGAPYTNAETEAEYKLATLPAARSEGLRRADYVAHVLAHNDELRSTLRSQDELNDLASQLFNMIDTDNSGKISENELRAKLLSVRNASMHRRANCLRTEPTAEASVRLTWRGHAITAVAGRASGQRIGRQRCTRLAARNQCNGRRHDFSGAMGQFHSRG